MKRKLIIIMGMHRSGTSLLSMTAKKLINFNFNKYDLLPNKYNPEGYHEDSRVVKIHDELLLNLKRPWGSYEHWLSLPDNWLSSKFAHKSEKKIEIILKKINKQYFLFKDPRFCLFLPLWINLINKYKFDLKIIAIVRNRKSVIKSLINRDGFSKELAEELYNYYNFNLIKSTQNHNCLFLNYEDFIKNEQLVIKKIQNYIGCELTSIDPKFNLNLNNSNINKCDNIFGIKNINHPSKNLKIKMKTYLSNNKKFSSFHDEFNFSNIINFGHNKTIKTLSNANKKLLKKYDQLYKEYNKKIIYDYREIKTLKLLKYIILRLIRLH